MPAADPAPAARAVEDVLDPDDDVREGMTAARAGRSTPSMRPRTILAVTQTAPVAATAAARAPGEDAFPLMVPRTTPAAVAREVRRRAEAERAWPFDERSMARAFLLWPQRDTVRSRPGYPQLAEDWLRRLSVLPPKEGEKPWYKQSDKAAWELGNYMKGQ